MALVLPDLCTWLASDQVDALRTCAPRTADVKQEHELADGEPEDERLALLRTMLRVAECDLVSSEERLMTMTLIQAAKDQVRRFFACSAKRPFLLAREALEVPRAARAAFADRAVRCRGRSWSRE